MGWSHERFRRLRILIVEDEPLVSMMLEDMLVMLAADVAGVCVTLGHVHEALGRGGFDAVLLDPSLGAQRTDEIAAQLCRDGIPFPIMSGDTGGAAGLGTAAVVPKPYAIKEIEAAMGARRSAFASK